MPMRVLGLMFWHTCNALVQPMLVLGLGASACADACARTYVLAYAQRAASPMEDQGMCERIGCRSCVGSCAGPRFRSLFLSRLSRFVDMSGQ